MTARATLGIPTDEFPFGRAATPANASVEIFREAPLPSQRPVYCWVRPANHHPPLQEDPDPPNEAELVEATDDGHLYRIAWNAQADPVLAALDQPGCVVASAAGTPDEWRFTVVSPDETTLPAVLRANDASGPRLDLKELHTQIMPRPAGLTPSQEHALRLAHQEGYFDTPRQITLEELGARLDISRQSVSNRLRRGLRTLLSNTFRTDP